MYNAHHIREMQDRLREEKAAGANPWPIHSRATMSRPKVEDRSIERQNHIEIRAAALQGLNVAIEKLRKAGPISSDYPSDQDRYQTDRNEHLSRLAELDAIRTAVLDEAIDIALGKAA